MVRYIEILPAACHPAWWWAYLSPNYSGTQTGMNLLDGRANNETQSLQTGILRVTEQLFWRMRQVVLAIPTLTSPSHYQFSHPNIVSTFSTSISPFYQQCPLPMINFPFPSLLSLDPLFQHSFFIFPSLQRLGFVQEYFSFPHSWYSGSMILFSTTTRELSPLWVARVTLSLSQWPLCQGVLSETTITFMSHTSSMGLETPWTS